MYWIRWAGALCATFTCRLVEVYDSSLRLINFEDLPIAGRLCSVLVATLPRSPSIRLVTDRTAALVMITPLSKRPKKLGWRNDRSTNLT